MYIYIYILYIIQFCSSHISCFCFLMYLYKKNERSVPVSSWDTQNVRLFDKIGSPAVQGRGETQQHTVTVVMSFQVLSRQMDRRNRWLVDSYPLDCQGSCEIKSDSLFKWSTVAFKRWGLAKLVLENEARSETTNFHIFVCLHGACALPTSLTIHFGKWEHMRPTLGIPKRVPLVPCDTSPYQINEPDKLTHWYDVVWCLGCEW